MSIIVSSIPGSSLPRIHTPPPLLTPQQLAVSSEGEIVVVTVGNSSLRFHYSDALKISQWLRVRAKEAKRRAGDNSRHWSMVATLDGIQG